MSLHRATSLSCVLPANCLVLNDFGPCCCAEVEAARVLETEEKHREYAESLRGQIGALDELQKKVGTLTLTPV